MRVAILGSDMERAAMLRNMVAEAIGGEISVGVHTAQLPTDVTFDLLILDVPVTADPIDSFAQVVSLRARHRVLFAPRCDLDLAKLAYAQRFQGFIGEQVTREMQHAILRFIVAGGEYFPWVDKGKLGQRPSVERLSKRQREVLGHLLNGKTNKQIADALRISLATVKLHVQAILSEAGARNRTEAVVRFGGLGRAGAGKDA